MPGQNVFDMPFTKIYTLLVLNAERKGRTKEEVNEVIRWLTGYKVIKALSDKTYGEFLSGAPEWNPKAELIKWWNIWKLSTEKQIWMKRKKCVISFSIQRL